MKLFQSQCYHKVPINMSTLTILLLLAALAAPVAAEQMTVTFGGVLLDLGATDFSGTYTGYYVFDTSTGIPSWDIVATFGRPLEIPGRPEAGLAQLVPGVGQQFEFTPMNSQSEYGTYVPPGINWARFTTTPDEYATLGYIRFEIDYESVINMNGIWLTEPFGDFWWAPPPGSYYFADIETGILWFTAPEPSTLLLLVSGLIGLAGYGRKKFFKK